MKRYRSLYNLLALLFFILLLCISCKHTSKIARSDKNSLYIQDTIPAIEATAPKSKGNDDTIKVKTGYSEKDDKVLQEMLHGVQTSEINDIITTRTIIDTVPEVLKKVFPDVYFVFAVTYHYQKNITGLAIYKQGTFYGPGGEFNSVFKKLGNKQVQFEDKFLAFLYFFEGINNEINLEEIKNINDTIPESKFICNKEAQVATKFEDSDGETTKQVYTYKICYYYDQFLFYIRYINNNFDRCFYFREYLHYE